MKLKQDWIPSPESRLGKVIHHEEQVPKNLLNVRDRSVFDDIMKSVRCLIVNPLSQGTEVCSLMACLKMCSFNSGFFFFSLTLPSPPTTPPSFLFHNLPPFQAPVMMSCVPPCHRPRGNLNYWLTMYWKSPNWEPEEVLFLHRCSQYFDSSCPQHTDFVHFRLYLILSNV